MTIFPLKKKLSLGKKKKKTKKATHYSLERATSNFKANNLKNVKEAKKQSLGNVNYT